MKSVHDNSQVLKLTTYLTGFSFMCQIIKKKKEKKKQIITVEKLEATNI